MPKVIKLSKGFDIKLKGKAKKSLIDLPQPSKFALKPTDFQGLLRPKVMVEVGDKVKAGTPILFDKQLPDVFYCAPVSGTIAEVKRGAKRKLLEVVIDADDQIEFEEFGKRSSSEVNKVTEAEALETMKKGGVWGHITSRPFGITADPAVKPKAIYVSSFDTHPLAADYNYILQNDQASFAAGLTILKKLTHGKLHLNVDGNAENASVFSQANGVDVNKFFGKHPAGNVGIQIHHLDPINKGDVVWTLDPVGVAQIGRLFLDGHYDTSRIYAIVGSEVSEPQYFKSFTGACISGISEKMVKGDNVRYISGNVLTGTKIEKDGYLGFNSHQLTVIPEGNYQEFLGWMKPSSRPSFHRALGLLSFMKPNQEAIMDTNTRGEERAFVQTGVFEKVLPMDILPTHLIKAIMSEDYDEMEGLGIYEVIEEDLALCEFVDVSKHPLQEIVREGLNLIQNS